MSPWTAPPRPDLLQQHRGLLTAAKEEGGQALARQRPAAGPCPPPAIQDSALR